MRLLFLVLCLSMWACSKPATKDVSSEMSTHSSNESVIDTTMQTRAIVSVDPEPQPDTSALERTLIDQGLIKIQNLDSSILADMKYSTTDNFLNADVYGDFDACYLQKPVAEKLAIASELLQKAHPDLRLLVHDCVRPRSVQYQMWEIVKGTDQQKYVAAPGGTGSMHNYGAAVDLTLIHVDSGLVDMGTPFDFFGKLAQPRYETQFLAEGKLIEDQVANRRLLRWIMIQAGFAGILSEWWHFNAFPKEEVKQRFKIVE